MKVEKFFEVGDLVRLKSGSCVMTVIGVSKDKSLISCMYFDKGEFIVVEDLKIESVNIF